MKHTTEQFDALIAFLPIFEKEGFRFSITQLLCLVGLCVGSPIVVHNPIVIVTRLDERQAFIRFCDGSLSLAHESGFLTGILRRLEQLSSEQTIGGPPSLCRGEAVPFPGATHHAPSGEPGFLRHPSR
jgi:hypothetical protein